MVKLRTWQADETEYDAFKLICARERIYVGDKINEMIRAYIKNHGEGNPNYELDQWTDNPQMLAIPAVMRTLPEWQEYINGLSEKDYRDLEPQIQALKSKMDERWKKGW